MSRIRLLLAAAAGVALVAAAPTVATPQAAPIKLTGTVGPGFTITLKQGAARVRTLRAGRYTITVRDRSNIHDFAIKGPTRKLVTGVRFKGTKTVTITLRKGSYTYVCNPHATTMKGRFTVT